jgi:hypothetical protein
VSLLKIAVLALLVATGLATGACGSSPSAPSQLASQQVLPPASSGATINGSITGAALSALSVNGTFASLTGSGLTVTVVGTSITASVNPNGSFVLTDVPPGDIQLRFTGPGTDALLTVTGIAGGDELRITVQVNGNTATLQGVSRKDKVNKVEIEGPVVSGTCASFVVGGTTIITDAATQFSKGSCADVIPGAIVQVKGSTQADGTVRATDVKFKKDDDEDDADDDDKNKIELEGLVTDGGCGLFSVRNVQVTTTGATVFTNGRCDEIAVGVRVHVRATPTGVGTALAQLVNVQRDNDDNGKSGDRDDDDDEQDDDDADKDGDRGNGRAGGSGKDKK